MLTSTLLTVLLLAAQVSGAQVAADLRENVAWLRRNASPIRTVNPADEDWTDLEPIGRAIGEARIVMLGEGSHGDGTTFLLKSRLIRFLHQQHGFDVIVWEAPFYEAYAVGGDARRDPQALTFERAGIFSAGEQSAPTLAYIKASWKTGKPITLVGLSQYVHVDGPIFGDVITFFEKVDSAWPTAEQRDAFRSLREHITGAAFRRPLKPVTPPQQVQLRAMMKLIDEDPNGRIVAAQGIRRTALMRRVLENIHAYAEAMYRPVSRGGRDDNPWFAQEARNLLFWANDYFPNRKLIVWAHSAHIARQNATMKELGAKWRTAEMVPIGDHVYRALGDDVYSIMFLAHSGKFAQIGREPRDIPAPRDDSLEAMMHGARFKTAFLDLRHLPSGHWLQKPQTASPMAYQPLRAPWPKCFDGIVYIDQMQPVSRGE